MVLARFAFRTRRGVALAGAGVIGAIASAAWVACSIYDPSLLLPASDAAIDAELEAAPIDARPDVVDTCAHARWPGPPAADDPSPQANIVFVDALRTLDLGIRRDGGAPPRFGYDLDQQCTCPSPDSCNTQASATRCDDDAGRDNTGGDLLRVFGTFNVINQDDLNANLQQGLYGLLIQIRDYNGTANDTQVTVSVLVSNGANGIQDGGSFPVPKDDGNDRWTIDPASLLGGASLSGTDCGKNNVACTPIHYDNKAYVSDHVLVASLDFPMSLGGSGSMTAIVLELAGSIVTAKIAPIGKSYGLEDGQIAGRWPTTKLLTGLAALPDPLTPGRFLCADDPTYVDLKKNICASRDIVTDPKLDRREVDCDALSVALGFRATPALLGEVWQKGSPPPHCGASYKDDCP
jgi:hypothetical protein